MRTVFKERPDLGSREMSCGWGRKAKVAFTEQVLSVGLGTSQSYKN